MLTKTIIDFSNVNNKTHDVGNLITTDRVY